METPVLNIQSDNNVYPGKDLTLQIKYVNTPRLVVRIYKTFASRKILAELRQEQ